MLRAYAELTVKVGLNLQPRQRLLIIGPVANGGCSLEAAPLVRQITAAAYDAGARLVETLWGDEALLGARLQHAPRDSFDEFSAWLPNALVDHVEPGTRRAVDLCERSGSTEGLSAGSRRRRAAGDRPRCPSLPRAHLPQPDQLGRRRGRGGGVGGARVSGSPAGRADGDAVGRDRAAVPARSSRSDRGVGNAPGRACCADRPAERQAVHRAALHRSGHVADHRAAGGTHLGRRTIVERIGHPLRAESAD